MRLPYECLLILLTIGLVESFPISPLISSTTTTTTTLGRGRGRRLISTKNSYTIKGRETGSGSGSGSCSGVVLRAGLYDIFKNIKKEKRYSGTGTGTKQEPEVLWLPFKRDVNVNAYTLLVYLSFFFVSNQDDCIGFGTWRIRPEDARRYLKNKKNQESYLSDDEENQESSDNEEKQESSGDETENAFRLMFLERSPKGTFGTADLKLEVLPEKMNTGQPPGLKITRFRPSQTDASRQAEVELVKVILNKMETIDTDITIKPYNRIFALEEDVLPLVRDIYVTKREEPL